MQIELPTYEIINDGSTPLTLEQSVYIGQRRSWTGWPNRAMRPVNEAAERVKSWWSQNHFRGLPPVPPVVDGLIYLPAHVVHEDYDHPSIVVGEIPAGVPRYRLGSNVIGPDGAMVNAGTVVGSRAWPVFAYLEPADAVARRVAEYYEAHRLHVDLPASPWCKFREGVALPELRAARGEAAPVDLVAQHAAQSRRIDAVAARADRAFPAARSHTGGPTRGRGRRGSRRPVPAA